MSYKAQSLVGRVFNRLSVLAKSGKNSSSNLVWKCLCECGNYSYVTTNALKSGHTKSCGCLQKEKAAVACSRTGRMGFSKHGHARVHQRTAEYRIWSSMIQRCCNPNHRGYKNYGGRGIKVCLEWRDFRTFFADMGKRPSSKYSLDRFPNNDGNYEPSNCRWATRLQQVLNSRHVKWEIYKGERLCRKELAGVLGISEKTLRKYLNKGLTPDEIADMKLGINMADTKEYKLRKYEK